MSFLIKMVLFELCSFGFFINFSAGENSYTTSANMYCSDLNPQTSLDIDEIMGIWYGSEVITHHDTEENSEQEYNSCVVIHLAEITDEMTTTEQPLRPGEYGYVYNRDKNQRPATTRYLKMIWDEKESTVEYILRFNNSRRGFWIISGPQYGNMFDSPHSQFSGVVQVIKAVGDHIVLTFCQAVPKRLLFSIVLTRQPMALSLEDVQSIRKLLGYRKLKTRTVRKVCRSSHSGMSIAMPSLLLIWTSKIISTRWIF